MVIPSRNGKELLAAQFPGIVGDLEGLASEIIVCDNGSQDGTADWLHECWPNVRVDVCPDPLSFARAVNRGIALARYSHICLLNNDMIIEPGFFRALRKAFDSVPDLLSATAQILFPPGVRREETGKAVYSQPGLSDFPIRCDEPLPGEDLTWVLYGSGGCTLYDAARLRELGGMDEAFDPVYVEDLDIGWRGWQRGWPSVYVAGAVLEHRHRATSSRYFTPEQLDEILELNYLRFVARAVAAPAVFTRLWQQATLRLALRSREAAPYRALRHAWRIALAGGPAGDSLYAEDLLLALTGGGVAIFPGNAEFAGTRLIAAGGSPQPGAVWIAFTDAWEPPSADAIQSCVEIVLVRRKDGDATFRAALRETIRKWHAETVRLQGDDMGPFAAACAPAQVEQVTTATDSSSPLP